MTDPEKTEDVEEALSVLKGYIGPALGTRQRKAKEALEQVRDTIRTLRSRLEEVEEERDRYEALHREAKEDVSEMVDRLERKEGQRKNWKRISRREGKAKIAARRRADRLEEAVREAKEKLKIDKTRYTGSLQAERILSAALDSREDEGEEGRPCPNCGESMEALPSGWGYDFWRCPECGVKKNGPHETPPVHADEPEGGESDYGDGFVDGVAWAADQYDGRAPFSWDDAVKASYEKSLVCERCGDSTSKERWKGGPVLCRGCRPTDEPEGDDNGGGRS